MRKKRKGYVKIHVAAGIKAKGAVSLEVTNDRAHDGEMMEPWVKGAQKGCKKAFMDESYDAHHNFKFSAGEGIEAGIKVREDANPYCGGKRREVCELTLGILWDGRSR